VEIKYVSRVKMSAATIRAAPIIMVKNIAHPQFVWDAVLKIAGLGKK